MIRDSVVDWQELSQLYEQADVLEEPALAAWLAELKARGHRLLPQLERMLAVRRHLSGNTFLEILPRIEPPEPVAVPGWSEGSRIGPYRLVRHVGSGGMAEVWLADRVDGAFARQVAIKLLFRHASSREVDALAQRFSRERDILASLRHPHIAGLHDAGVTADGQPWLALEYVEGEPITAWCDAERMAVRDRLEVFRQVLAAVQHAHKNLIIHRDLKPANILVTREGQVRLLDFGIAKLLEPEGDAPKESELTLEHGRPLTLQYASPEQVLGQALTTACDIYSLGVVLYELVCGARPYDLNGSSAAQVEQAIVTTDPAPPSRRPPSTQAAERRATTPSGLVKALDRDLDAIVCKCLAKQPGARYSSVEALAVDLQNWRDGRPVAAKPTGTLEQALKFCRRHRLAVGATFAMTLALLTLTAFALVMGIRARNESVRAVAARDFLIEMFRVADPDRAKGTEPTARNILESASDRAVVDLKEQPDLLASVLDIVAQMQGNLGLFTVADTTLGRLAALQERTGKRHDLAMTLTNRALNAYQLGDEERAAALIANAASAAAPFAEDHELQARLVLGKGWIARGAGNYTQAREDFTVGMAQSALAFGSSHIQTIEAMRGLAEVEGELGRHDVALALLADAVARANADASADERYRQEVAIARANALLRAGRFHEAAATAGRLMPACERLSGKHNADCDFLRRLWAVSLLRTGPSESALPLVDDLLLASADPSAPILQAVSAITAARALAQNGLLDGRPEVRVQLGDIAAAASRPATYRVQALLTLAEAGLLASAYGEAEQRAREALALLDANPAVPLRGRANVTLALGLEGQGRREEALALLQAAEADLERDYGREHPLRMLYGLNRAVLLARTKRGPEALTIVDAGLPGLRVAFGASSPLVARVESARGEWLKPVRSQSESARTADMFF
ncbi:MAG: serine/threonine protein kinase [Burkholderiales bacterium]|nr:serine/threonine protein kinase [Burkholderiales bacterium]